MKKPSRRAAEPAHFMLSDPNARFIRNAECIQGDLKSLEPIDDGLLQLQVGAFRVMIPETMQKKLQKLVGQRVEIARIGQQYGVRKMP